MHLIVADFVLILCLLGCSSQGVPTKKNDRIIFDAGHLTKEWTLCIPAEEAIWAKQVIAQPPSSECQPWGVDLEPTTLVVLDGVRYALEENEIILLYGEGSKTWHSNGIKNILVEAAQRK